MNYKDCKYNTSKSTNFEGYCDLPKYHTKQGMRLVKCCESICEDFELKEADE